jgi:anaerobic ribonucleoside-triphosphate reductase activating protein
VNIRIAGIVRESIVDGPGIRYVIFTQGCPHRCKGCHNPQTHDFSGGVVVDVNDITKEILYNIKYIDGITISGGEPLAQPEACIEIIKAAKKLGLHVVMYTGYTWEQLLYSGDSKRLEAVKLVDALVDGPFIEELKSYNLKFRGSSNQRFIDVKASLAAGRVIEVDFEQAFGFELRIAVI